MTWDHASNSDEEDIRLLIAYLGCFLRCKGRSRSAVKDASGRPSDL
jgi:hypothetical protein